MLAKGLRHGVFMSPYHAVEESPTLCLRRDIETIKLLDRLGFHEAWMGEHHSGGFETISSPELMIAAAAEKTQRIRLGTGVITLPFHNPLMVANRITQLDHMTMGRAMFGFGPGLLPADSHMLDIDPMTQRDRMIEAIEVIMALLRGETVTKKTDWFSLKDAKVHLLPYTQPYPELAVASAITPSGGILAGKYGLGLLCVAATDSSGFNALDVNWAIAQDTADQAGKTLHREQLRLVGQMHIAETREQARANVRHGLQKWLDYVSYGLPERFGDMTGRDPVDVVCSTGSAVIGTPDDAIAMIERLLNKQGDFGAFLQQVHDWADWDATRKSHELYARYVIPHFSGVNAHRRESIEHAKAKSLEHSTAMMAAANATRQKYASQTDAARASLQQERAKLAQ